MSWEEGEKRRVPCPCGKGEVEETDFSDNWNRSETRREILCEDCRERYVYDHSVIHGHPGNEVERGWVLKSTLEAERREAASSEEDLRARYYAAWKSRFKDPRGKKDVWKILTVNGKFYPSLQTFYKHTKGLSEAELQNYVDSFFHYSDKSRIVAICEEGHRQAE